MGVGSQEVLLILFFALIFFGANRIPGIARGLGKGIAEFKKAARDIQDEITRDLDAQERRTSAPSPLPPGSPEQTAGADPDLPDTPPPPEPTDEPQQPRES